MPALARKINHSTTPVRRPRGSVAAPVPEAWDDFLLGYALTAEANGITARSIANRHSTIRWLARYLRDQHGITDPDKVEKSHMQAAMAAIHKQRARSGARTAYNDLKAALDWWADDTGRPSPLTGIKRPGDVVTPVKVLTAAEIESILRVVAGRDYRSIRDSAIVHLLLETGMRRAELCALDVGDIDVRAREATIRRGKGGRSRVTVYGAATASALHRWIRTRKGDADGALFVSSNSERRLAEYTIGVTLRDIGERAGVKGLRAHVFRHSWTHWQLAGQMQEHDLLALGGWNSTTQLGRYGAALAAQRARVAGKERPVLKVIRGG